jgi:drug/metabolite transporter (DMT)-like permease
MGSSLTTIFIAILIADSITLVITIASAIKKPSWRYKLTAGIALCATLLALQQVLRSQGDPFALIFTVLLIVVVSWPRSV